MDTAVTPKIAIRKNAPREERKCSDMNETP